MILNMFQKLFHTYMSSLDIVLIKNNINDKLLKFILKINKNSYLSKFCNILLYLK